ncbi:L-histidine N(alpha)-methyltransferase [Phormidesmis sp. 146-12]
MEIFQVRSEQQADRLRWITLSAATEFAISGHDVIQGLTHAQKTLPCQYLYDDRGSALFEQICDLPEYYPTRTEQAILEACASEVAQLTGACELVELGSGSSRKTRLLLDAYQPLTELHYCPIDVSAGILKSTALNLLTQYPTLRLCGFAGTYEQALAKLPPPALKNRMLIFLGSTLGNLDEQTRHQFLAQVQQALQPGEFFLLGVDLQKPIDIVEAAYNDAQKITAAFNLNILQHLNQRFQGNFVLNQFRHLAFYNSADHHIEMHLKSLIAQTIELKNLDYQITLQAGETIRTEISRKFNLSALAVELEKQLLQPLQIWTDSQAWFGLLLCQRQCSPGDCP